MKVWKKIYVPYRKHTRKRAHSRSKYDENGVSTTYNSCRCVFHACCRQFIRVPEIYIRNVKKLNVRRRAGSKENTATTYENQTKIIFREVATSIGNPRHYGLLLLQLQLFWEIGRDALNYYVILLSPLRVKQIENSTTFHTHITPNRSDFGLKFSHYLIFDTFYYW